MNSDTRKRRARKQKQSKKETGLYVSGLCKSYYEGYALWDFDLEVEPGEAIALIGPNGSGKTTALRTIAGRLPADDGFARLGRHKVTADSMEIRANMVFVSDSPVLFDDLTLAEHLEFIGAIFGVDDAEAKGVELMETFALADRRDDLPTTFSRGMRQRSQLCLAFLRPSKLMLIDEPFVGLDPRGMGALIDRCLEYKHDGGMIVVATHVPSLIQRFCDRVIVLSDGEIHRRLDVDELPSGGAEAEFDKTFIELLAAEADADQ